MTEIESTQEVQLDTTQAQNLLLYVFLQKFPSSSNLSPVIVHLECSSIRLQKDDLDGAPLQSLALSRKQTNGG